MQHVTNQRSWFKTYQPINKTKDQPIEGINGVKMKVKKVWRHFGTSQK